MAADQEAVASGAAATQEDFLGEVAHTGNHLTDQPVHHQGQRRLHQHLLGLDIRISNNNQVLRDQGEWALAQPLRRGWPLVLVLR